MLLILTTLYFLVFFSLVSGCAANYVVVNGGCEPCNTPTSIGQGMIGMLVLCCCLFPIFCLIFIKVGRPKSKKKKKKEKKNKEQKNEKNEKPMSIEDKKQKTNHFNSVNRFVADQGQIQRLSAAGSGDTKSMSKTDMSLVVDRVKIVYGWLQIFTSMIPVFPNVPFPESFKMMALSFNVINLDLGVVFGFADCSMSLNYLEKFVVHSTVPIALLVTLYLSSLVVRGIYRKNEKSIHLIKENLIKWMVTIILIMYPGLCVKTFLVLKCSNHGNLLEKEYLMVDYTVQCWTPYHMTFVVGAFAAMFVYVAGVPLMVLMFLYKNRAHLYDATSPKHEALVLEMGSLYTQC